MDAGVLEQYLRAGLSLEKIGELTERHPSTVGYWVKQHGLAAVHRDRHAPKGGVDEKTLGERGLTRSLGAVRDEVAKCVLLCADCHAEVEGGIVTAA